MDKVSDTDFEENFKKVFEEDLNQEEDLEDAEQSAEEEVEEGTEDVHEGDELKEEEGESPPNNDPKNNRDDWRSRVNEERREKFKALDKVAKLTNEKLRIEQENQRLRELNEYSANSALQTHEQNAIDRLNMARDKKTAALEAQDIKAQIEADELHFMAVSELQNLEYLKARQETQRNFEPEPEYEYEEPAHERNKPNAIAWGMRNPWFNPNAREFDPTLAQATAEYTDQLDNYYFETGRGHEIFSDEYLAKLDSEVYKYRQNMQKNRQTNRNPYAQQRSSNNSAPRGSHNFGNGNRPQQIRISNEEKEWIRHLSEVAGVKPEEYLKSRKIAEREAAMKENQKSNNFNNFNL